MFSFCCNSANVAVMHSWLYIFMFVALQKYTLNITSAAYFFICNKLNISASENGNYSNKFMERSKGVEGAIVNAILKPLVTKLMNKLQDLYQPENMVSICHIKLIFFLVCLCPALICWSDIMSGYFWKMSTTTHPRQIIDICSSLVYWQGVYHDVRNLMLFVQEHHGNPFRRIELSAMLDGLAGTTAQAQQGANMHQKLVNCCLHKSLCKWK